MKHRKGYIVLIHKYTPKKQSTKGEWEVLEECEFVDKLRDRHLTTATAIINTTDKVLDKNRVPHADYNSYIEHITKTYPDRYKSFLEEASARGL